jgi:uncharacterized membrane protein YecN with MAPEG domain
VAQERATLSPMGIPAVTALYGSLNAIFNIFLANRVSDSRRSNKVAIGVGSGDHQRDLEIRIRTHGNNAEFVPLAIVMLLLAELCGGASLMLHILGGTLLVARLAHAPGMAAKKTPNAPRFFGTAATWTMIVVTACYTLYLRTKL